MLNAEERIKELQEQIEWEKENEKKKEEIAARREKAKELRQTRQELQGNLYRKQLRVNIRRQALRRWIAEGGKVWHFNKVWPRLWKEALREHTMEEGQQEKDLDLGINLRL